MKEESQHGKSPIDFKRDSGGSITVGQEGDSAICMIVLNDRLLLVMTSAVYLGKKSALSRWHFL